MLTILHRDDRLVVIDKPSGWLVHRSNLDRHETRILVQALRDQIGRHVYPVHRLDKGTSGVMLFALDPEAAQNLAGQFERHEVRKTYLAVVRGWPPESGFIDHALSRQHDDYGRTLRQAEAQPALTRYRRLATVELPFAGGELLLAAETLCLPQLVQDFVTIETIAFPLEYGEYAHVDIGMFALSCVYTEYLR